MEGARGRDRLVSSLERCVNVGEREEVMVKRL